ncbi:hypothetical protein J7S33_28220, partial [Saccharothrix algeriensis]
MAAYGEGADRTAHLDHPAADRGTGHPVTGISVRDIADIVIEIVFGHKWCPPCLSQVSPTAC